MQSGKKRYHFCKKRKNGAGSPCLFAFHHSTLRRHSQGGGKGKNLCQDWSDKERNVGGQLLGFLARLALTLALEIGLALVFGYGYKPVLIINLFTQICLNAALAVYAHSNGGGGPLFYSVYMLLEILIVLVEWAYYHSCLPEINPKHPGKLRVFVYALLANALSFGAGVLLNMLWPMSF